MLKRKTKLKECAIVFVTFIAVLIIWQAIDYFLKIKEIILPTPIEITNAIVNNFVSLLHHTGITLLEAVIGFIIAVFFALFIAMLFAMSARTKKTFYSYVIALQAIPVLAIAPLLTLWFGNGMLSKMVMSALVAFFPILVGGVKGFTAVEPESLDLFRSLSVSKWQTFTKLRFPNSLPYLFPAFKTSATLAVIGATISEFTGASAGIGHLIIHSSYYLDTSLLFASIVMISLAGILFFYLVDFIEKKVVFWQINE